MSVVFPDRQHCDDDCDYQDASGLLQGTVAEKELDITAVVAVAAIVIRFICSEMTSYLGYLSSKTVKKTLRGMIYKKLLKLENSYKEKVQTSEIVQVAVEGVEQLETYFGAYLPQFFYAMLAPLTLFMVISFVNLPSAIVLLVCVPLIPVTIVAIQRWAKKLISKYWGQYTALGDTFLENLQGLTTLKIYQADQFKHEEMNEQSEKFRKIIMKVLIMQLNSITIMDLIAYGGAALGVSDISEESILKNLTYINHQSYLFKGTVRDNLLMGNPNAAEARMWEVLERVNLAEKVVYIVVGCIGLGLGAVGSVVPMLPAFPFLLLAAFCFGKSSERLHTWFINTKLYKNNLESYVQGKGMTWAAKIRIMGTVTAVMLFSFIMMKNVPVGRAVPAGVWVFHILYFIFAVKTLKEEPSMVDDFCV